LDHRLIHCSKNVQVDKALVSGDGHYAASVIFVAFRSRVHDVRLSGCCALQIAQNPGFASANAATRETSSRVRLCERCVLVGAVIGAAFWSVSWFTVRLALVDRSDRWAISSLVKLKLLRAMTTELAH
jgi:hypothetical protein